MCIYRVILLYVVFWLCSMAALVKHSILNVLCMSQPGPQAVTLPIPPPIPPPAVAVVARCQEVFEPAILAGWDGGGGGGGVAAFQKPPKNQAQATLECAADWERAATCLLN